MTGSALGCRRPRDGSNLDSSSPIPSVYYSSSQRAGLGYTRQPAIPHFVIRLSCHGRARLALWRDPLRIYTSGTTEHVSSDSVDRQSMCGHRAPRLSYLNLRTCQSTRIPCPDSRRELPVPFSTCDIGYALQRMIGKRDGNGGC